MPEEIKPKPEAPKPKPEEKKSIEKPDNCMKCNKRLQRKSWYYRNNGYYCSKRCWKLSVQDKAKKQEKPK